jgi:hypothetical protein
MQLRSLSFAGYRSFPARGPAFPDRPLQTVALAPLTIVLGKNNSGKSIILKLIHHVLTALASSGPNPFPMSGPRGTYGRSFRDIQHGGYFFNPLDFDLGLTSEGSDPDRVVVQIAQPNDLSGDAPPIVQNFRLNGIAVPSSPLNGLLPGTTVAERLRSQARQLLERSCYLGPVRQTFKSWYPVPSKVDQNVPESDALVAQMLFTDAELRTAVGVWTAKNLDNWRVDIKQNLDLFQVVARRSGREVNICDSGQGLQQVLPVAVLCCSRSLRAPNEPFVDAIEQPELHLHDAAQAPLGDLCLSALSNNRGRFIIETHSEALVLRIRRRVAEGLSPEQVSILFVEDIGEHSTIRSIKLDEYGEVDWWPEGVFSEAFIEVKAMRRAQRRKTKT